MRCALHLAQPFGEPAGCHCKQQHDERNLGDRGDEKQAVRPAGVSRGIATRPPARKPNAKPKTMRET